jgi:hypothetical protein
MPNNVRKLFQELSDKGIDDAIIGTVEAVQETTPSGWALPDRIKGFWCDVQPEKESETLLQHVPMALRVLNTENDLGVIIVPKQGTEVLVTWVDKRPTIEACQEWERLILKKGEDLWIEIDVEDNILVQTAGAVDVKVKKTVTEEIDVSKHVKCPLIKLGKKAPHPVVWGDNLMSWLANHVHPCAGPGNPSGKPVPPLPAGRFLSKVVFTD